MKRPLPPTLEELMEAIRPVDDPTKGRTTSELSEVWNIGPARAREVIKVALESGRMEVVPVMRSCIMRPGHRNKTNVFVVKE